MKDLYYDKYIHYGKSISEFNEQGAIRRRALSDIDLESLDNYSVSPRYSKAIGHIMLDFQNAYKAQDRNKRDKSIVLAVPTALCAIAKKTSGDDSVSKNFFKLLDSTWRFTKSVVSNVVSSMLTASAETSLDKVMMIDIKQLEEYLYEQSHDAFVDLLRNEFHLKGIVVIRNCDDSIDVRISTSYLNLMTSVPMLAIIAQYIASELSSSLRIMTIDCCEEFLSAPEFDTLRISNTVSSITLSENTMNELERLSKFDLIFESGNCYNVNEPCVEPLLQALIRHEDLSYKSNTAASRSHYIGRKLELAENTAAFVSASSRDSNTLVLESLSGLFVKERTTDNDMLLVKSKRQHVRHVEFVINDLRLDHRIDTNCIDTEYIRLLDDPDALVERSTSTMIACASKPHLSKTAPRVSQLMAYSSPIEYNSYKALVQNIIESGIQTRKSTKAYRNIPTSRYIANAKFGLNCLKFQDPLRPFETQLVLPISRAGKESSMKYAIAEAFWYRSKRQSIELIEPFGSIWNSMTDKHGLVNSNYGYQICHNQNVDAKIEKLYLSGVCSFDILSLDNVEAEHDVPCNNRIICLFDKRHGRLDIRVFARSIDMIYGLPYDMFAAQGFGAMIIEKLRKLNIKRHDRGDETGPQMQNCMLRYVTFDIVNAHIYKSDYDAKWFRPRTKGMDDVYVISNKCTPYTIDYRVPANISADMIKTKRDALLTSNVFQDSIDTKSAVVLPPIVKTTLLQLGYFSNAADLSVASKLIKSSSYEGLRNADVFMLAEKLILAQTYDRRAVWISGDNAVISALVKSYDRSSYYYIESYPDC